MELLEGNRLFGTVDEIDAIPYEVIFNYLGSLEAREREASTNTEVKNERTDADTDADADSADDDR